MRASLGLDFYLWRQDSDVRAIALTNCRLVVDVVIVLEGQIDFRIDLYRAPRNP